MRINHIYKDTIFNVVFIVVGQYDLHTQDMTKYFHKLENDNTIETLAISHII